MTLQQIKTGDHLTALQALRDHLVDTMVQAEPPAQASLAKQLQSVLAELATLERPAEDSLSDDLAKRRQDRLAKAKAPVEAGRRNQQRRKGSSGTG